MAQLFPRSLNHVQYSIHARQLVFECAARVKAHTVGVWKREEDWDALRIRIDKRAAELLYAPALRRVRERESAPPVNRASRSPLDVDAAIPLARLAHTRASGC